MALDDGTALRTALVSALKLQFPSDPAQAPQSLDEVLGALATAIAMTTVPYLKENAVPRIANVREGDVTVDGTLT
jgi:hypothetical protein